MALLFSDETNGGGGGVRRMVRSAARGGVRDLDRTDVLGARGGAQRLRGFEGAARRRFLDAEPWLECCVCFFGHFRTGPSSTSAAPSS